jgi:heat induced stress protein YflT
MNSELNSVVAVFHSHDDAEAAVRELQQDGFDMKQLSIVGKDLRTEEHVVGYYNSGDRMMYWGKQGAFWGAFWGGMWAILFGSAFFWVPGIGPLLVAGPLALWIVGVLEGAVIVGGVSALGGALASIGIPNDSILKYETEVKNGKILLVAHGTADEVERAKDLLDDTKAMTATAHAEKAVVVV